MAKIGLDKNAILGVVDIRKELVDVPEWGKDAAVWVRGMTGAERDKFESSIVESRGKGTKVNMVNVRARLASLTICDEGGNRLFTQADIAALSAKSASALQRIFAVAQRLSGIGDEDVKDFTEGLEDNPLEGSVSD